ncbi:MAG: hypothetical protein MK137_00165 [Rickettsiales bacterium]|nr:hypothetical protein [Rickettsiales bacterium]
MVDDTIHSDPSASLHQKRSYSNTYDFRMIVKGRPLSYRFVVFENPLDAKSVPSVADVMSQLMQGMDKTHFLNTALQEKKDTEGYRLSAILDEHDKAVAVAGTRMQYGASGSKVKLLDLQHFVVDENHRYLGLGTKLLELTKKYYVDHLGQKPNRGINVTLSMGSLQRNHGFNKQVYMRLGAVTDMIRAHIPTSNDGKLAKDLPDNQKMELFDKQYHSAQKQIHLWQELAKIAKDNKEALQHQLEQKKDSWVETTKASGESRESVSRA